METRYLGLCTWTIVLLFSSATFGSAIAACDAPGCCQQVGCSCPTPCQTPAADDLQAQQDTLVCLEPDTPEEIVNVLETPADLARLGYKRIAHHPGVYVLRRLPGTPARGFTTWNEFVTTIQRTNGTVEADHRYERQSPPPTPNDPQFKDQWPLAGWETGASCKELDEFCALSCRKDASLAPLEPWEMVKQSSPTVPVVIGMIDEEVPYLHPDLAGSFWQNPNPTVPGDEYPGDLHGYNAVYGIGLDDVDLKAASKTGHGTSVASIMAALNDNGKGIAGVMQDPQLVVCSVGTKASQYAACLRYFVALREQGLPLAAVNISGGGYRCSCCIEKYIRQLRDVGVLVVAAAGNRGCANGPLESSKPTCQELNSSGESTCGDCPFYPASQGVSNVISVGASLCSGAPKRCSNYGRRSVHLFAPGHDVLTLGDSSFAWTSAAAPHVTGVIGLLKSTKNGAGLDWRGLRSRVLAGARAPAEVTTTAPSSVQDRLAQSVTGGTLLAWEDEDFGKAAGAVSCKGRPVRRRLRPFEDSLDVKVSEPVRLVALSIVCEKSDPEIPVEVKKKTGATWTTLEKIKLKDDGQLPDECPGDGEHAGDWAAPTEGDYKLVLWDESMIGEELDLHVTP